MAVDFPERRAGGFSYDLCERNAFFTKRGMGFGKINSTGTVIVGVTYRDGVVLAADCRATSGSTIADKYCDKLHRITNNIYCAGAGTAADLDKVGNMLSAQMKLLELSEGRKPRVLACMRYARQYLFKYQGYVGAYLIIGGCDHLGPYLGSVHAHGSAMRELFIADGSGCMNALAVLERDFRDNLTREEAIDLAQRAAIAGMEGDMACGNALRYVVITKDKTEKVDGIVPEFINPQAREQIYSFKPGTTGILKTKEVRYDLSKVEIAEVMETD
jgi:20S proteasome subunit beta 2